ncbi:MAG: LacI family DNA-binding transcriptional regulator [Chitinophagaceae bacterium]
MIQKPATIKEIAKRLNVSVSTVSRALHNHPSIGLRTKMQVQKLAEELNYEPNQAAISFKQGKTFTIGVILPNLGEEFFSTAINGIEDIAIKNNYTVLIGQSHDDIDREKKIVDTMRRHRVDGLLVSLSKNTDTYGHFEQLEKYSIPVVFFDRVPDMPGSYSVSCNLKNSSVQLVDWLVSRGHKYIGFIKGPETMLPSQERLNGFLEGLKKNKLSQDNAYIVQTDLDKEKTFGAMKQLLHLKTPPTAIIAFNDYVALDAIKYSRAQGLKINKDIFFVSYANLPMTSYLDEPPLASVEQFPYEQAEKATEILIQLINKKSAEVVDKKVIMQSKVIVHQELDNQNEKKQPNR